MTDCALFHEVMFAIIPNSHYFVKVRITNTKCQLYLNSNYLFSPEKFCS